MIGALVFTYGVYELCRHYASRVGGELSEVLAGVRGGLAVYELTSEESAPVFERYEVEGVPCVVFCVLPASGRVLQGCELPDTRILGVGAPGSATRAARHALRAWRRAIGAPMPATPQG